MLANPYDGLPQSAFWRSAVAEASPFDLQCVYTKKFPITSETLIATAGSCFAQHISRYLKRHGFSVLDVEPAPIWLPPELHGKYGFSIYSARYGNIYTLPQLLQLAKEAAGRFAPADFVWLKDGKVYDALRPAVEPSGLDSEEELRNHRQFHLEKVLYLFRTMDLLIFTLGLTEAWTHRASGTVYPTAPGVLAGAYDASKHAFVNYDFVDLDQAFSELLETLRLIRKNREMPNILLTVSPVPLVATATGGHVLQASTYSKAVLRAFAGSAAKRYEFVDYFPSYEIVTNQAARGTFFASNLRSVTEAGVETVMKSFFAQHKTERTQLQSEAPKSRGHDVEAPTEVQCEEAILEAFGQ